jgi:hypothetical protein
MNCERFSEHLIEEIKGSLDEPTSRELQEHMSACATCRQEARELDEVWKLLGEIEEERTSERMRARFFAMLEDHESTANAHQSPGLRDWLVGWWPRRPAFQAAVALATLLFGLWLGSRVGDDGAQQAELQALKVEVQAMTEVVTLSLLQHQSASERLRAVGLSRQTRLDAQLTTALLDVINHDPSVNVRLAALDVLAGTVERAEVHRGLLDALPRQTSPMMQLALADVVRAMNGPRSRETLEEILQREELMDTVREHFERLLSERPQT